MAKLNKTTLAKRRATILEKKGVRTDALERYKHDIKIIEKSNMSKRQKAAAVSKISARFVRSKTSTPGGIEKAFDKMVKSGMITEKGQAAIKTLSDKAAYINASQSARRFMEAKILGMVSDQISYAVRRLHDVEGLTPHKESRELYKIMGKVTDEIMSNKAPASSDIYRIIDDHIAELQRKAQR